MAELLHHLGCMTIKKGYLSYQLVQDFFHQLYFLGALCLYTISLLNWDNDVFSSPGTNWWSKPLPKKELLSLKITYTAPAKGMVGRLLSF